MASTSRCPRPGRSPRGSKRPHHRVWLLRWPVSEGLVMGCPGGVSTRGWKGQGMRDREELGWGRACGWAFWVPLPPPSFQRLYSSPTSLSAPTTESQVSLCGRA